MNDKLAALAEGTAPKSESKTKLLTVRELMRELVAIEDPDSVVNISFFGSNAVPLVDVDETEEGVTLSGEVQ